MQHPVTTEYGQGLEQINETLEAVAAVGMQALVFWPNVDAGSDHLSKGLRLFREERPAERFHFFRNLPPEDFIKLMAHCACMVGNSSAALREGAFIGTPAVSVGTRQHGRESGANVVFVDYDKRAIADAIRDQVAHGPLRADSSSATGARGRRSPTSSPRRGRRSRSTFTCNLGGIARSEVRSVTMIESARSMLADALRRPRSIP